MFTDMRQGTAEDWAHIAAEHYKHQATTAPQQILESLRRLEAIEVGFLANQGAHKQMDGSVARVGGASDEDVVAELCEDLGNVVSIAMHGAIAAEMVELYVSEDVYDVIYWHLEFQGGYYLVHV